MAGLSESRIGDDVIKSIDDWIEQLGTSVFTTVCMGDSTSYLAARAALKRFHAAVDRRLWGNHFYKLGPDHRTFFVAFCEGLRPGSKPHFHLMVKPSIWKVDEYVRIASPTWKKVCVNGSAKTYRADSVRDAIRYSRKAIGDPSAYEKWILSTEFLE